MNFSIIVPIYNISKYIHQCVNSVLMQNYYDFELILVNDGSTDDSENECLKFHDSRIKYFKKENGGLSDARNFGIEKSTGDYILFLDGDDYYDCSFLEEINRLLNKKNVDVLVINSKKIFENHQSINHTKKEVFKDDLLKLNIYKACARDKVIKRSFLQKNKLFFKKGVLSEDILWCGQILFFNPEIDYYQKPIYCYRQRAGSISKTVSSKHINDIVNTFGILLKNYYSDDLKQYISY